NTNVDGTDRLRGASRQWGLRTDATRVRGAHRLEAGVLLRQLGEDGTTLEYDRFASLYRVTADYDADSFQGGAYLQDTWTGAHDRLSLTAGLRLDRFQQTDETRVLPRAAATWNVTAGTRLVAGYGRYAQFPRFEQLFGMNANPELTSESASHASVALERTLGTSARLRVGGYQEQLHDLVFLPETEWRIEGGRIRPPRSDLPLRNDATGPPRGVEGMVQRRR